MGNIKGTDSTPKKLAGSVLAGSVVGGIVPRNAPLGTPSR
jgi:hypothetical protein